jgi:hypothetical protein
VICWALTNKESFNAFNIFYYDYEEYIGHGYVLGKAVYAPGDDWGKADTARKLLRPQRNKARAVWAAAE